MFSSNNKSLMKNASKIATSLVLYSHERFEIIIDYNERVINVIKSIKSSKYDHNSRKWNILLSRYKETVTELNKLGILHITYLPNSIIKIFNHKINNLTPPPDPISRVSDENYLKVDRKIRESLFPFQVQGVKYMIGRHGRCLLADDMGLGKSVQSLGAASYYRDEWPLLVISPSSVKMAWRDQVKKWITEPVDIHVICTGKDIKQESFEYLNKNSIVLVSYDLVSRLSNQLLKLNFKVVIMDESHFIKSGMTARAKGCIPLAKKANRLFLLSGTPALSRPSEMFTQIDVVAPTLYNGYFKEFGNRYCDPQMTNWGTNYNGSSNTSELQILLNEGIMLRRLKSEVLGQLPEKRREVILLASEFLEKASLKRHADIMTKDNLKSLQRRGALLEYFHATGKAKIDAIKNYIDDLLESPRKFLFFAHHIEVLNAVEEQIIKKKVGYVRIDGSVSAENKRIRTEKFQTDESIQIAILSIVAAGTGITLTAATLVVFGELFWNPGILLQAENRCHRIGQKDFVNIHYLVAEQTADDYIWPLVQNKMELLTKVGLNKENFKNSDTKRLEESFSEKNTNSKILDYFQSDFIEDVQFEEFVDLNSEFLQSTSKDESEDEHRKVISNETPMGKTDIFDDSFDLEFMNEFDSYETAPKKHCDMLKPAIKDMINCKSTDVVESQINFVDYDIDALLNDSDDGWVSTKR